MTMPDITAETCDGAAAWAGGSQKWNGTARALSPNPNVASAKIRAVPCDKCGAAAASAVNVQSSLDRLQSANITNSASVPAWVMTDRKSTRLNSSHANI